jgi:hypothetical protein
MSARLKVYSRIHEPLGHVIYRINREFVKRAPEKVDFVDHPRRADLQIVQCIGAGSLAKIWNNKYILFQHCLLSADLASFEVWRGIFDHSLMVVAYIDLPALLKTNTFNFHLTPWGVDTTVFRNDHRPRTKGLITTGWSLCQEALQECYLAVSRARKSMVNLGADFQFGEGFSAVSRLTDAELCNVYNDCEFVSGLRFKEGFEVSVVEGLACGCRPICFDLPTYRNWFGELACYVPPSQGESLVPRIENVLRYRPRPVSEEEMKLVRETFDWQAITSRFWKKVFDYV